MRHFCVVLVSAITVVAAPAFAQLQRPTFSVDFQGPSAGGAVPGGGVPDGFLGLPINEGDILTTTPPGPPGPNPALLGPLPPPGTMVGAFGPGSVVPAPGLGILPGAAGFRELDALSYGRDIGEFLYFSVEEHAVGVPTGAPDVFSEGTAGSLEASADVFVYAGPVAPTPPAPVLGNTDWNDGNGLAPPFPLLRGFGLIEPNPITIPLPGPVLPDAGDNLDAVDMDTRLSDFPGPIFFSMDSSFPDPYEPFPPVNNGTAVANGFSGADVVCEVAPGPMIACCPAAVLGLDLSGFDTDDLDALIFNDADASTTCTSGDTLLFSVRRGSAVIGALDSCQALPIEEGDILTFPAGPPGTPCIFIAAEALGLATVRAGTSVLPTGDELDALDIMPHVVPAHPTWVLAPLAALLLGTGLWLAQRRRQRSA
jgi:hypothetical protein